MTRNKNKTRLKHFIQQWFKDYFLPREESQIYIHLGIAFLCTRVQQPNEEDWEKLIRLMKYVNGTRELVLTLSAEQLNIMKWFVDAAYAVHADFKSHTGMTMTMGQGAIMSMS